MFGTARTWSPETRPPPLAEMGGAGGTARDGRRGQRRGAARGVFGGLPCAPAAATRTGASELAHGNPFFAIELARGPAGGEGYCGHASTPLAALTSRIVALPPEVLAARRTPRARRAGSPLVQLAAAGGALPVEDALRAAMDTDTFTLEPGFRAPLQSSADRHGGADRPEPGRATTTPRRPGSRRRRPRRSAAVHRARSAGSSPPRPWGGGWRSSGPPAGWPGAVRPVLRPNCSGQRPADAAGARSRAGAPHARADDAGSYRGKPAHRSAARRHAVGRLEDGAAARRGDHRSRGAGVHRCRGVPAGRAGQRANRSVERDHELLRGRLLGLLGWLLALHRGRLDEGLRGSPAGLEIGRAHDDRVLIAQAAAAASTASLLLGHRADDLIEEGGADRRRGRPGRSSRCGPASSADGSGCGTATSPVLEPTPRERMFRAAVRGGVEVQRSYRLLRPGAARVGRPAVATARRSTWPTASTRRETAATSVR